MTDLKVLNEVFTELERRADAAIAARTATERPRTSRPTTFGRPALVAATVAVVAGLAVGAVLLARGGHGGPQTGAPPATSPTAASPTAASPTAATEPGLPDTPDELTERFRAVLGDLATFEVTETGPGASVMTMPPGPTASANRPATGTARVPSGGATQVGAYIGGTLTTDVHTGGFDLTVYPSDDALAYHCPDGDLGDRTCVERELADGSRLIIDDSPLQVPGGRTYGVDRLGADGTVVSIHLSNLRNPKGPSGSPRLADRPPLTTEQLVAIVTSELW